MRLLAPAKINLHLRVGPADGSGFHPISSWMCNVGLFDNLTLEQTSSSGISFACNDPSLPADSTNLVVRAAEAICREVKQVPSGLHIDLQKQIPIGGGLGGGSSDAARILLGIRRLWNLSIKGDRLNSVAASLGSDIPFFLHGSSSLCSGRGEVVIPMSRPKPRWVLLILPGLMLPTAQVYRQFDQMGLGAEQQSETESPVQQWADLSAGPLLARLINDLEKPAFALCPQLSTLRAEIEQKLARIVRMSGSGSSLFSVFDEFSEAESAAARVMSVFQVRALAVELANDVKDDLAA